MKIVEVTIDRFGQFYKWSCRFSDSGFLTVYGPNEAGKTTLVTFIKCIFFGFPKKSELLPYTGDADHQSDLGGSVSLSIPDVGKVKIVRHHQRKNGRAIVFLENGEMMSEEILSEWLKGMDRDLYDAIFCFDLEGLKGIDQLKPAELNHFLFSTGMMGNAELFSVEKRLEKEAGDLFKSGGRNPVINQTISELNTLRGKITSWEDQMEDYLSLKSETTVLEEELIKTESARHHLEQEKRELLRFKASESLLIDCLRMESEIAALPDTSQFPENGKERFDHWRTLGVSLHAELSDIEQKAETLQKTLLELGEDDPILQFEREIISLGRESSERGSWERELARLIEQIRNEQEAIRVALDQLNMSDLETIKDLPVSLSNKQALKDWINQWQEAGKRKSAFEISVEEEESKLQVLKEKQNTLQNGLMPEAAFRELEHRISDHHPERLEQEKERITQELFSLKRSQEISRLLGRLKVNIPIGQFILFIVLSSVLFFTGEKAIGFFIIGTSLLLAVIIAIFLQGLQKRFKPTGSERDLSRLLNELESKATVDISQSLYLYNQEKSRREQLSIISIQMEEGKRSYQTLIMKLEQINVKNSEIEAGIHEWRKTIGLPECDVAILPEVYQLTEKVREQVFRLEGLEKQASDYQKHLEDLDMLVRELGKKLEQPDMTLTECDSRLANAKLQKGKKEKIIESLDQLRDSKQSLKEKLVHYDGECKKLMELAAVDTEEDFYRLNKIAGQKAGLEEQLDALNRQLMHLLPQEEIRNQYFTWLLAGHWAGHEENDFIRQIDEHDQHIKQIQQKQSDIKSKLDQMEKDETYADILHDYEEKRFFLNEEAKKWGTLNIALSLLKQAKEDYRETRLPKVLESASHYLHQITNRLYKKIYYTESEGFTLERTDGTILTAGSLSRGTGEQLYLSLRLALIDIYKMPVNLPIIVDDGFVNFDAGRRRQVIDVLKGVANARQVLLFTCHRYKAEDILELSGKKVGGDLEYVGPVISDTSR